jgi:redox-sensitive bicupin YhaK (pirin superfamily)
MSTKQVEAVLHGSAFGMVGDGFRVTNYFPNGNKPGRKMSPFILLDYHPPHTYTPTKQARGVGVHPHRGFETVTLAFQGAIAHHDSFGGSGTIFPGDVQWMTAGSGLLHKEYHEAAFTQNGGVMQMLQLWVNLPGKDKNVRPRYQAITRNQMTRVQADEGEGFVEVIAGEHKGAKGPAMTFTPIHMYRVQLSAGAKHSFEIPENFNTGILWVKGNGSVNETREAKELDFLLFNQVGTNFTIQATTDIELVVLAGEPIDEPVVQYGPFVMNHPNEIQEAIEDYHAGKYGVLEE